MDEILIKLTRHSQSRAKQLLNWKGKELKARLRLAQKYGLKAHKIKGKMKLITQKIKDQDKILLHNNVIFLIEDNRLITLWQIKAKDMKKYG